MARSAFDNMAWSPDSLVREIYSEVDDRPLDEIADSIYEVYFGTEEEYEDEDEPGWVDPTRSFQEPRATKQLTKKQAADASILASQIVDWANYAKAYGDYDDPPWEREGNPKQRKRQRNTRLDWWTAGNAWLQQQSGKEYQSQLRAHLKRGRKKSTFRYSPPDWIRDAVAALGRNDEETFKAIKLGAIEREVSARPRPPKRKGTKRVTNVRSLVAKAMK